MIVEATLDANWRSSLTITPKEVDTFSSKCETLWIEKTVWYAKPLELWPGPESSSERVQHKARDSMRSDVPPVTPSGEARDDCHGMRWWRHHLKTSLVVPTQSTPSSRVRRSLGSWQCITTLSDMSSRMSTSYFVMFRHVVDSAGLHWSGTSGSGNACAGRDDVAIQKLVVFFSLVRSAHHKQGGNTLPGSPHTWRARVAVHWQHEGLPAVPKCSPPTCSTARHTDRYRSRQSGAVMHHLTVSTASNAQQISSVPRGKSLTASAKERARFLGRREANKTSLAPSRPTWPTGQAWYHMPSARVASRTSLVSRVSV